MTSPRPEPKTPLEAALDSLEVSDEAARRVARRGLDRPRRSRRRALGIVAGAAVAATILAGIRLALDDPPPGDGRTAVLSEPVAYSLSNHDGLLVLKSPDGQWIHMSGGAR